MNVNELMKLADDVRASEERLEEAKQKLRKQRNLSWERMWDDIESLYVLHKNCGAKRSFYYSLSGRDISLWIHEHSYELSVAGDAILKSDPYEGIKYVGNIIDRWDTIFPKMQNQLIHEIKLELEKRLEEAQEDIVEINNKLKPYKVTTLYKDGVAVETRIEEVEG